MTKIKMLSTAVLLIAAAAAPVFAQDRDEPANGHRWEPTSSAESERPRPDFGTRNTIESGDFAVTDGLSGRGRSSIGHVAPGTSNAPCGNCGGE
jgi:hypothetical protein